MPTTRLHARPRWLRCKLRYRCAAVAAIALIAAWEAAAQDMELLRGEVPEEAVADELLRRRQNQDWARTSQAPDQQGDPAQADGVPTYRPASSGAVPDPDGEIDGEDGTTSSVFGDSDAPAASSATRTVSTARRRAEEAENRPAAAAQASAEPLDEVSQEGLDDEADMPANARTLAARRIDAESTERVERAEPVEGIDRDAEENPYAPLGLRLGSFNVYSTVEQGLTWTSNVNSTVDPEEALVSESALRLQAVSDWARHSATLQAFGTIRETVDGPSIDDNEAGFNGGLQLDLSDSLRGNGSLSYLRRPESASSPVVIEDAVSRPLRETFEGTLGLEKDLGKLRLAATGGLVYDTFGDAELAGGGVLSQDERNSLLGTVRLRAGYEISPAITPFVEVEAGRREYEVEVDSAGYARSADRLGARAGVALDMGEKLRGELAAGWLREAPDDSRLQEISGATLDANLVWSPVRGTNVTLYGGTAVEGTTTAGESGSLLYTTRLNVQRQIRASLTGSATVGAEYRDYVGSDGYDLTLSAEAGLTWWLNRYFGVTGRARHEEVRSNLEGRETETDSVFLGVRLQR